MYHLIYLLCDNEAFEKSLFDLDTIDNSPEFKKTSKIVSTRNEDDIPVFLDNKTKLVLVGIIAKHNER